MCVQAERAYERVKENIVKVEILCAKKAIWPMRCGVVRGLSSAR